MKSSTDIFRLPSVRLKRDTFASFIENVTLGSHFRFTIGGWREIDGEREKTHASTCGLDRAWLLEQWNEFIFRLDLIESRVFVCVCANWNCRLFTRWFCARGLIGMTIALIWSDRMIKDRDKHIILFFRDLLLCHTTFSVCGFIIALRMNGWSNEMFSFPTFAVGHSFLGHSVGVLFFIQKIGLCMFQIDFVKKTRANDNNKSSVIMRQFVIRLGLFVVTVEMSSSNLVRSL